MRRISFPSFPSRRTAFQRSAALALAVLPGLAPAQTDTRPDTRLVFLGADPAEARPGAMSADLEVLDLARLPAPGAAATEVLAAVLRASPVSTLMATPDAPVGAQTGDLHLVVDAALSQAGEGPLSVTLGGETMPIDDFASRLGGLVEAFNPEARQIAWIRIEDPDERFAAALPALRGAIDPAGFGMTVLMVGSAPGACDGPRSAVHYALLGGIADSDPFGDADGTTTVTEATGWLSDALERDVARGAPCAARYSLILRGATDPDRALVSPKPAPLFPEMETAVYRERFEAMFLMSAEEEAPIRAYLDSCTYCPAEDALTDRLREIGERRLALDLETGIWDEIKDDIDGARISVYLENCQLCAYRDEAEAQMARFAAIEAAREDEAMAFRQLAEARDLRGLRDWIEACVACDFVEEARATVEALEADGRVEAEAAQLEQAVALRNADDIRAWMDSCEVCVQRGEAEEALARLEEQTAAAEACLVAAGLPQQGGPRLLSDIAQPQARALCGAALAAYPSNPLAVTALGRIEQAAGNLDEAKGAYEAGMEAGIPAAYGLAAHALYAPGQGGVADYAAAEALALEGHARGDWLSGEVLTVIYSQELIPGKGAAEAFDIARTYAEAGNPVAQFFTGYFHRIGAGTPQSDREAERWLSQAVEQGYLHANSFLAELYEEGADDVQPDPERAVELYWNALSAGDPTALDRLANQINDRPGPIVAGIQARMREIGAFSGAIDGIGGNNTANAIRTYAASIAETPEEN